MGACFPADPRRTPVNGKSGSYFRPVPQQLLSELGDISRFRNAKTVCAYAGLVPVVRQSGERKSKDLKITKEGSGLLRWALVEAAWRLVGNSPKWAALFARLMHRSGKKRAIVAVARKLLCGEINPLFPARRRRTLDILSWPEALNASRSRCACRMAIQRNACSLLALPDFPEFAQAVSNGVSPELLKE